MADNSVFITGAADGAFADALNGLPPWATENTALAIEKQLRSQTKSLSELVKTFSKGGGGGGGGGDPKIIDQLNKLRVEELKEKKKEKEEAKKKAKADKEKADKELIWGKKIETANQAWLLVLAGLSSFGNKVKETLIQNIKSYDAMHDSGLNVVSGLDSASNGFEGLRQITALTGVRYSELQASMLKFNTAINAFGVGKFAKTVGIASKDLTQFGYSSKEAAELTGEYLESQRGFTDNRNKSEKETAAEVVQFGERITNASMATGMMRGKILENLDAISKSTTATLLAGQTSTAQSQKLQEFGATFKDQKLGNQILKMMSDPVKALNTTFTALNKTGGGAFAQAEMNFVNGMKNSGKSAEEMQAGMADFVKTNESSIQQQIQQNALLEQGGVAEAGAANEHLNALLQQSRSYNALSDEDKEKLKRTSTASKDLANAQERLASQWQRSFANLIPVLDLITWGLNAFSTVVESVVDFLGPVVTTVVGIGAIILSGAGMLVKGFRIIAGLFEFIVPALLNPFTKLIAAFTAGYAIGTFIYKMVSDFQWFNTMMETIFKGLDHILQYIPGSVGSDAKERLNNYAKVDAMAAPNSTEISVPKNPTPSTINSPSAPPTSSATNPTASTQAVPPSTPVGPGIEKPPSNTDINSLMAFQNSMTEQLLLKISTLVSVNQDQLKYARNST